MTFCLNKACPPEEKTGFKPLTAPMKLFNSLRYDFLKALKGLSA